MIFGHSCELKHIGNIHSCTFGNGYRKGFLYGIHMVYHLMLPDRALIEHIRFVIQLALLVQLFQRTKKIVGGIGRERKAVASGVDQAILLREGIVQVIEFSLLSMNHLVGGVAHLQVDQLAYTVAQCDHALDALLGGGVQLRPYHQGVLPIVYLIIHDGIGIVSDIGVGRNGI